MCVRCWNSFQIKWFFLNRFHGIGLLLISIFPCIFQPFAVHFTIPCTFQHFLVHFNISMYTSTFLCTFHFNLSLYISTFMYISTFRSTFQHFDVHFNMFMYISIFPCTFNSIAIKTWTLTTSSASHDNSPT